MIGTPAFEHHREVAREPRDRDLRGELAEDRHLELDRVDDAPDAAPCSCCARHQIDDDDHDDRDRGQDPPHVAARRSRGSASAAAATSRGPRTCSRRSGTTNVTIASTPMIAMMSTIDRVRDGRADLVLQLGFALVVLGDRRAARAPRKPPVSPTRTMLSMSGGKTSADAAPARPRTTSPTRHRPAPAIERGLQLLVVGLLDEDRERPHERQARVDAARPSAA